MICDMKCGKMAEARPKSVVFVRSGRVMMQTSEETYSFAFFDDSQLKKNFLNLELKVTKKERKTTKMFHFDISIKSYSFQSVVFTDQCAVLLRTTMTALNAPNEVISCLTNRLTLSKPISFDIPQKIFDQKDNFNIELEILPFDIPRVPSSHWLLYLMFNSFSELASPITQYCEDWPFMSWLRQNQATKDASVSKLYDTLFSKCRDFDFDEFKEGVTFQRPRHKLNMSMVNPTDFEVALRNEDHFSCDLSASGLSPTRFYKFAERLTRAFAEECGLSYQIFASSPRSRVRLAESTDLLAYVPEFSRESYIVSELVGNSDIMYRLYALVREEEGVYTASYYSPKSRKFYDVRNNSITPISQKPPPMCNVREQYLFLLYVHDSFDRHLNSVSPIMPFLGLHEFVKVYRYPRINDPPEVVHVSKLERSNHLYFSYDHDHNTYPSVPLDTICGESVLDVEITEEVDQERRLVWDLVGEDNFSPRLVKTSEIKNSIEKQYVSIHSKCIDDADQNPLFAMSSIFCVPVTNLSDDSKRSLCILHFTEASFAPQKPMNGTLVYTRLSRLFWIGNNDKAFDAFCDYIRSLQDLTYKYEVLFLDNTSKTKNLVRIFTRDEINETSKTKFNNSIGFLSTKNYFINKID